MNKHFLFILLLISGFFVACTKKQGPKEACFYFSKSPIKLSDTLYLFNCSKNYENQVWFLPGGQVSFTRHAYFIPSSTGKFDVALRIGNYIMTDTIHKVRTFEVIN